MSSHAALGGHVEVHDFANIGWGSGVHQFCQVGRYAMLSACSKLVQDVPPFMLADEICSCRKFVPSTKLQWKEPAFLRIKSKW